jgi:hypothetical protein
MRKLAILSAVFIITALFTTASFAQSEPTTPPAKSENSKKAESALVADWDVTISAPGQDLAGILKLEKDGDNYKGSVLTDLGEAPLKNIKINDDNTFTAEMTASVQGQVFEGTITGKLADEKISGEINLSGLGAITYSGKKAEKK